MTARIARLPLFALLLATLTVTAAWQERYKSADDPGNLKFHAVWDPRTPLVLRFAGADGATVLRLTPDGGEARRGDDQPDDRVRLHEEGLRDLPAGPVEVLVKLRPTAWTVYLADRFAASLPPASALPVSVQQDLAQVPANDRPRFQKVLPFRIHDDFMIPEEEVKNLGMWQIAGGNWHLHSALDRAREINPSQRVEQVPLDPEHSPNFYSLKGQGSQGMVLAGYPFHDDYRLQAAMRTAPGQFGLVFYHRAADDYYRFTIRCPEDDARPSILALERVSPEHPEGRLLHAVRTPLTHGQWVQPRIIARDRRIQCFLDNVKVIDIAHRLPPGGHFGLYVNADQEITFDDVEVESHRALDLGNVADIRFHGRWRQGRFWAERQGGWLSRLFGGGKDDNAAPAEVLDTQFTDAAQALVVGAPGHEPHVFSAQFHPRADKARVGLIAGWQGPDQPHYRFTATYGKTHEGFALMRVQGETVEMLEQLELPLAELGARPERLRLMADATTPGELRCYRNGDLVLVHTFPAGYSGGASGIFLGEKLASPAAVTIDRLSYRFEREGLYRNRYEKNQIYVSDPYMRHWSSPEGEWYTDADGHTWSKSDFYGRFSVHLPLVEGSTVQLGVPEGSTDGALVLRASDGKLALYTDGAADAEPAAGPAAVADDGKARAEHLREAAKQTAKTLESADKNLRTELAKALEQQQQLAAVAGAVGGYYTIHYEGHWLWVTSGARVLLAQPLNTPLAGRRLRIAGFSTDQLMLSHVDRFNVRDYTFTEAPHDWQTKGGEWRIINRFQCLPKWSHMNGEAAENVGGMWSKYRFRGDFCVEMYAGVRHGNEWYARPGDLNLTMLSAGGVPSRGYTVTTTGWDPNHSQLWTRLYRNGEERDRSDDYLVPRVRAGSERRHLDPLLATGRPVHGAWYYLKLRRVGKTLEYWFDNQLVFRMEDDQPVDAGRLGFWTYRMSMMVARVKVAAEQVEVLPIEFERVYRLDEQTAPAGEEIAWDKYSGVQAGDHELAAMRPEHWQVRDEVGRSRLEWYEDSHRSPYFVCTTQLGSGSFRSDCKLPARPVNTVAGWRFRIKRTDHAAFNFHYSVGVMENGKYVPKRWATHRLSGSDYDRGDHLLVGSTELPAVGPAGEADWHRRGDWQEVVVWIDPAAREHESFQVRAEGFGNRHPSFVMQGLTGNGPGEAYAVQGFAPVPFGRPTLAAADHDEGSTTWLVLDSRTGSQLTASRSLAATDQWLAEQAHRGFADYTLRAVVRSRVADFPLAYVELPEQPSLAAEWDPELPETLRLHCREDYPDPRLDQVKVRCDGVPVPVSAFTPTARRLFLPRDPNLVGAPGRHMTLKISPPGEGEAIELSLSREAMPQPAGPVLRSLEGPTDLLQTFEDRTWGNLQSPDPNRMRLLPEGPERGWVLEIANKPGQGRLNSTFATAAGLARFPVLQFDYKADEMTNLTLKMGSSLCRLNEPGVSASGARFAHELIRDGQWHTWTGMISDAIDYHRLYARAQIPGFLEFRSIHKLDQTGDRSWWRLDDIVLGPAVADAKQLTFTADYHDFDGVAQLSWAVRHGPEPWTGLDAAAREPLQWHAATPGEAVTPSLDGVEQGLCRLFIRATDNAGNQSRVTDIPFVHDRQPVKVTHQIAATDDPTFNGTVLNVHFDFDSGAPLELDSLRFSSPGGGELNPGNWGIAYRQQGGKAVASLNWPYVLREQIQAAKDGDTVAVHLDRINDGAGNSTPAVNMPIKLNFGADQRGPTFLNRSFPANVLWRTAWEGRPDPPAFFTAEGRDSQVAVHQAADAEAWLELRGDTGSAQAYMKTRYWTVADYPYLAMRLRRPSIPAIDNVPMSIELHMSHVGKVYIPLNWKTSGSNYLELGQPIQWREGQWHYLLVDLRELLKQRKLNDRVMAQIKVVKMGFFLHKGGPHSRLDISSCHVFGPWQPAQVLSLEGYDASGINGLTWEYLHSSSGKVLAKAESKELQLVPAMLPVNRVANGWLLVRLRDRAGNLGYPLHIPLPK